MGFFIIREVASKIGVASKIKKKTCDHNGSWSSGSLKIEQNANFGLLWGSITILSRQFFWQNCCNIALYMIFKKTFPRAWVLIAPKEGSKPNFVHTLPRYRKT